ncbi:hypothetical protein EON64_16160, partial [archaeon]
SLSSSCDQKIARAMQERDFYLAHYARETARRKELHNMLLELRGNIRVYIRVRPILDVERRGGGEESVLDVRAAVGAAGGQLPGTEEECTELVVTRDVTNKVKYEFDRVFPQSSGQLEVFSPLGPLIVSVLDGFNVCIFAYGQTGSGKTFTMEGCDGPGNEGVAPRAIRELFRQMQEREVDWTYTLTMSMLEIYNETVRDLLGGNKGGGEKLEIRQTPEGNQVLGLTEVVLQSVEQADGLMKGGRESRAVGGHDMNEHSSRSHSILILTARGKNKLDGSACSAKLNLIDLAGSERVSKTDASGERLKEAQNINKSLLALGDVITALGNKKSTHVPYRNSKLTFLLQDSLGGNSKVCTIVTVSPSSYNMGETVCSLNFATRCRATELGQAKRQITAAGAGAVGTGGGGEPGSSVKAKGSVGSGGASNNSSLSSSMSLSSLSAAATPMKK